MKTLNITKSSHRRSWDSALCSFSLLAAFAVTLMTGGIVKAGDPPPVVVNSIEPAEIIQGQLPQPEIQVFGSDFIEGFPSETNRPTVTLRQQGKDGAEYSALAFVNFGGTVATLPAEFINLLQAPLGVYDVIVTRPTDDAIGTLKGAFTVTDGEPEPGEIVFDVQSVWGGMVTDIDVVGDLAFAAIGRRLVVLDISGESNPVEIGSLYIIPGVVGVRVSGDYAFLSASKPYRFCVVDISDPTNPTLVSAGYGQQFHQDVQLYGHLAYTRDSTNHVHIFDITDPLNIVLAMDYAVPAVAKMSIAGDYLYVGTNNGNAGSGPLSELRIYDLSGDPLKPALLGSVESDDGQVATGLSIEGDYAAWTMRNDENSPTHTLHIVDISDPAAPTIVGTYNDFNGVFGHRLAYVDLVGGYAYVAEAAAERPRYWSTTRGLLIFDIATDPTNPTIVSTFKTHGDVRGVRVIGNRAYLFDQGEGLIILDVSDPTNPVRLGNFHSPSTFRDMTKVGDLLYVTDAWNGFTVLDVSDADHPEVVSVYLAEHFNDLGVNAWGITVQNDLAYLGAGHLGLEVVDVSDPADPIFLGAFRIPSPVHPRSVFAGVAVSGDIAHLGFSERQLCGGGFDWFLNLDVSDPQGITELGRVQVGCTGVPLTIALNEQSIAFLGRRYGSQVMVDTSDASNPIVIYDSLMSGHVIDAVLAGNLLYTASSDQIGSVSPEEGLWIQDVTNPANPIVLAHVDQNFKLPGGELLKTAYAVATQNQRLYVVGTGRTFVFDVSDPRAPDLLDFVMSVGGSNFGTSSTSVLVDEPYQYVANANPSGGNAIARHGLVILKLLGINPADLDGDGLVSTSDLLILFANWGPCPPPENGDCPADLDGDGSVGTSDLLELFANWG